MSSRKIRGLTRTGRQVSEDPDLDNLLSTLSPEEVEELEKDMMKVPDPANLLAKGDHPSHGGSNSLARDFKASGRPENDPPRGRLGQREPSPEDESKKESSKQEPPRKGGLSQEENKDKRGGLRKQASISTERDARPDATRSSRGAPECSKDQSPGLSSRYSRRSEARGEDTKEPCEDSRVQREGRRESTGSKTKDMISKLQEKKEKESQEKEKKEDSRRKDDSKTKDIISKLREKSEREAAKEKERKEEVRTRGRVSMLLEKQSKADESQVDDNKPWDKDQTKAKVERQKTEKDEGDGVQPTAEKVEKKKEADEDVTPNDQGNEERKVNAHNNVEEKSKDGENNKCSRAEKAGESKTLNNCDAGESPRSKGEEEEDEDSSMFDELMEQVRTNDPSLLELNVNNSEVIRVKTLIQFAETLHKNTYIKTFALANCRADDHVAYAIAGTLRHNSTVTSINLDSNLLTGKGIMAIIQALQHNSTLTELRFHNQRHICGGKTEMEMTKILKDNITLLKLGYHFELAGPRMTMTNILSRNMDRQRQKRFQEQKLAQANGEKKGTLEVPKSGGGGSLRGSPRASPKPSPMPSPMPSPKLTPKRGGGAGSPAPPPPPPPPGGGPPPPPPPPMLDVDSLRNSLTPVSRRKMDAKGPAGGKNSRDQLLASIRGSDAVQLKKVPVPKWLQ
ncbi:hypothetical protein NHX12_030355 [Muraenolepis orangiensis]|uniref:Leiomodin-1 n=1 Tax=Muraenolepis orangiensis TaxID=630683 RepID=A0A9Q0IMS2_9TELE|nr:hypothetical protein NHX12_030355 [Muraenolepis orangiensis]